LTSRKRQLSALATEAYDTTKPASECSGILGQKEEAGQGMGTTNAHSPKNVNTENQRLIFGKDREKLIKIRAMFAIVSPDCNNEKL